MAASRNVVGTGAGPAEQLLRFLALRHRELSPLRILTHDHPDPDALAAAYGLHYLAREAFGVESKIIYRGAVGRTENRDMVRILEIPARRLRARDLVRHRHVALVDTQPVFENNPFPARRRATIVIDQHPSVTEPSADLCLVDTTCGCWRPISAASTTPTWCLKRQSFSSLTRRPDGCSVPGVTRAGFISRFEPRGEGLLRDEFCEI
jgi:hypothetical protein